MSFPAADPTLAVEYLTGERDAAPLLAEARRMRDAGKGRVVTYSPKVFIPLTTLCRDRCTYCTFAKPPAAGGEFLTPDDVLAIARAGAAAGCTEALFTLGDRPEARWSQAAAFLEAQGCQSTLDYTRRMTELVDAETSLLAHANPGIMDAATIGALRRSNPSMGLMLENASPRLLEKGMPHYACPDKDPTLRLGTIAAAGRLDVPFTTGILVGIGETHEELVESLFVLAEAQKRAGHIQEIIVQNFRAKADTPMRRSPEPSREYMMRVVAVTRWVFGPAMNVQVPPNLTEDFGPYLDAGINDWGGVSPLTIDWVNPDAPWPHLERLRDVTEAAGFRLEPRLPVYPEFVSERWIDPGLLPKVRRAAEVDRVPTPRLERARR